MARLRNAPPSEAFIWSEGIKRSTIHPLEAGTLSLSDLSLQVFQNDNEFVFVIDSHCD